MEKRKNRKPPPFQKPNALNQSRVTPLNKGQAVNKLNTPPNAVKVRLGADTTVLNLVLKL